jgi:hypothetical protein
MPFPFSATGSFRVRVDGDVDDHAQKLIVVVREWLDKNHAKEVILTPDGITFKAGAGRAVSNWNILAAVGRGTIQVSSFDRHLNVLYRLDFTELVISGSILVLPVGIVAVIGNWVLERKLQRGGIPVGVVILPMVWLWLVGMNYAVALLRVSLALRKITSQYIKTCQL